MTFQLCKIDIETGITKLWRDNEFIYPGEPKFLPKPDSTEEDDGILMTTCSDRREEGGQDYLVFLDGKTMEEVGRASVAATSIPQSLHGIFLPDSAKKGKK
jgi:carotenoid cleavage dioxygenase-like enzyme